MIAWLVPASVFKTVEMVENRLLGSIPRRSRKTHFLEYLEVLVEKALFSLYKLSFFILCRSVV